MIKFADMFCGGGLGARGAVMAGCHPVAAVDSWDIAGATYKDNFPDANVTVDRIENVDPVQATGEEKIDLLLTSPECTNHSVAKGAKPICEISRRSAFHSLTWAKALDPRWIIMENVPQIRSWERYPELLQGLADLGYGVQETILNSAEFGVPQARRRWFLMCEKGNNPLVPEPITAIFTPVSSILDPSGVWRTSPLYTEKRAKRTILYAERAMSELGDGSSFLVVYYGSDASGGWQSLDEPLRTVTTLDRFALVEKIAGEYRMRMLQPNELARAMGLPVEHRFNQGTRRDKVKLCGNGICAPVMSVIVQSLIGSNLQCQPAIAV
ncbi:DNA cytosine methyltransferase [uncultured Desulfuromusa sp.]|uniref:DNA cytosine methyltransferase n=1 Tax=uncultured Desulfuromusa sp. TaxID=219183 RepID=UPI002AA68808|nr:DNA cytosine methyltransferase [uncultured Desulfuromusa sp.]